jgi:hypothetical protein
MWSAAVQEQVQCAIEMGASTLGVAARVNLTFGCAVGDATLGDVGCTLGALGCLRGNVARGKRGLWVREMVGLPVCRIVGGKGC